jgi:hypothetical protein
MAVIRIGSAISTVIFLVTVSAKNFEFRRAQSVKHENGIISDEFVSQHFELDNGAMIFTKSWKTPIVMPTGDYAITGFWVREFPFRFRHTHALTHTLFYAGRDRG